ncbi:MAG: hypothetical protein ACU0DH_08105 [Paracoccus sp. (in: a-proteobacteria)]|uniref:hypothetical protein n=1 Tax=Paracoccus sp. TaxID=267 RepID=UPI00405978BE
MTWVSKRASSTGENWLIDETPTGEEERTLFLHPELLTSTKDTRDILERADYQSDILGKRDFSKFVLRVGSWWSLTLIAVVLCQGFGIFALKAEEFIAVVTTTTASVFGLAYVIGRYLFGSKAYASKTSSGDSVAPK